MKNKAKQILVIFLCVTIIVILFLIFKLNKRTIFNDSETIGNTAGNLYNGGLFCEYDGTIFFSNDRDNDALYSMDHSLSNVKKLSDDKPLHINADENYIYYARANYSQEREESNVFAYYNHGLYRINKNGKNQTQLSKQITASSILVGNYIYYQVYERKSGLDLYKVKIDGSDLTFISDVNFEPFSIMNRIMYYTPNSNSKDHYIRSLDLDSGAESIIYNGNCHMPIATVNGIYYISLEDKHAIAHIDYQGNNKEIIVNEFCSFYNISEDGRYLYYQIDNGDNNRFAMMDLDTMTQSTLLDGNYKNIHVIGKYVFFRDFHDTETYAYDTLAETISIFKAPVLK